MVIEDGRIGVLHIYIALTLFDKCPSSILIPRQ